MTKIFITGANGFVGKNLIAVLKKRNLSFIAGDRSLYGDLVTQDNWSEILRGCASIIHLAERVHVMEETSMDPLEQFRMINVRTTLNIALAAKRCGIKRFIFISSVKVNGEETLNTPFTADDKPSPKEPYGISKMEAEVELLKLHEPGIFEIVIIRPPLIYGAGVKANFERLYYFVNCDLPMPFALVKNKRSLVSVFNLLDLIITTLTHPNASGEIFLVSDDKDLSLRELIERIAKIQGKIPHLLPVPVVLMKLGARLIKQKIYADRLFGNLQVDITKTKRILKWSPPYTFEDTFKA